MKSLLVREKSVSLHPLKQNNGRVAQLNRVADYGSAGYRFESCRDHESSAFHVEDFFFYPISSKKKSPFTFIQLLIIENEKVKGEPLLDKYIVSVSAILSCRPFFILIFLLCIKMKHYGFSRKSIWKNLETFP